MTPHSFRPSSTALAVALALSTFAPAVLATTNWTGDAHHFAYDEDGNAYRVNDSNAWENSGNWSNGAPASNEAVNIDRPLPGLSNQVAQLDSARTVGSLNVGTANNGLGQLNVGGSGKLNVADGFTLGTVQGATGKATFNNGATLNTGGDLIVGKGGSADLNLKSGSRAHSQGDTLIGSERGATGTLIADGGSTLTSDKRLVVGGAGNGTLLVKNGSQVNSQDSIIAADLGSTGTASVDGAGSLWKTLGDMTVGQSGNGSLSLTNGAKVQTAGNTVIAAQKGSNGSVSVDNSTLSTDKTLIVGGAGNGTLLVKNGSQVNSQDSIIAADLGSTGTASVDGAGSLWKTLGDMTVGQSGNGSLSLTNGAKVQTAGNTVIAAQKGSNGSVSVDNGTLSTDKTLIVGGAGNGVLEVKNGGQVNSQDSIIAADLGSTGSASVDGAGSLWKSLGDMIVGQSGNGSLSLTNGAKVQTAGNTVIAAQKGSSGKVSVDNGTLSTDKTLIVGGAGNGVLEVKNGGQVNSQDSIIAADLGSTGSASLDGAGSLWKSLGDMIVGQSGNGSLSLTNGAKVQTAGNTVIAAKKGSSGTVSVDNGTLSTDKTLIVGGAGNGVLDVKNGGQVNSQDSIIAADLGSNGSASLDGAGSLWKSLGDMIVGQSGNGSLSLTNGAKVQNGGNTVLGAQKGSNGSVSVDNGTLSTDKTLIVGGAGNGALDIKNGGQVTSQDGIIGANQGANGSASVDGTGSLWETLGDMIVGQSGNASLVLANQGVAKVGGGTLRIANDSSSNAALYVGATSDKAADAKGAGHLEAKRVVFGQGQGLVQFNHSDRNYQFDAGFEGKGRVNHIAGQTVFNGDSSGFTGQLNVKGGELLLNNRMAGQVQVDKNASLHIGAFNGSQGEVLSDIGNDGQVVFDRNNQYQYDHVIYGSGSVEQRGTGSTVLTGENTYKGGTLISNGTLQLGAGANGGNSGSILGDVQIDAPGSLVFNRANAYTFGGALSGTGTLYKRGAGRTELSGDSSAFHGRSYVDSGILAVNGKLGGSTDVYDGATLAGNGQVGNVTLHKGATIAPGNSIGTLSLTGDLDQHSGSTFHAELLSTGANDRLLVNGAARLEDGSIINADKLDSKRYELDRRYLVLATQQGLSGRYKLTGDTWVSTFYDLVDNYDSHNAYLDVQQTRLFQEAAFTPNQRATATAAQSLKGSAVPALTPPVHNKLFEAIAYLPDDHQARDAFDQLSGEFHNSTRSALIQDSRLVRDAANSRLRSATVAQPADTASDAHSGLTPWITTLGNWGEVKGDSNTATLRSDTKGFLTGVDTAVGDSGHVGVLTGYSRTDLKSSSRDSSSDNDNIHLGVYGGTQVSGFDLRGGMAYTWSRIDAKRSVNFAGYSDHLKSKHDANTLQAFGELGRRFDLSPSVQLEPFANLAYVQVKSEGFKEDGGPAALRAKHASDEQTFSTLGLRASADKQLDNGKLLTVFGSAGWKHALAGMTPSNTYRFDGSDAFRTEGAAYSRNSAVVEAGVETRVTPELSLGAAYSGQLGSGASEHGLSLNASYRF
ncbi:autotransporter domain-containing protein [Pseudomonas sp. RW409]|uniref:autotransporter domain-containing protein n=1 Tax=Pseudomonas sp. RW409 TaxID=2202895 RepID=UPI000D73AA6B|nr:autotransporter domain-containing protein [Pseudomonas sp. RW409]PWY37264.1 autotransporter outer membrane beta-barrel domain-containing protein [Pseudomonas sp. RW409]